MSYKWLVLLIVITGTLSASASEKLFGKKVSLVFADRTAKAPISWFGHVFIRIQSHSEPRLSDYTINYGARFDPDDNIFSYASKGVYGGYKGNFKIVPFYEIKSLYNDIEYRDLWEIDLQLSKGEIKELVKKILEENQKPLEYKFFSNNCTHGIQRVLPDRFKKYTIPYKLFIHSMPKSKVRYTPSRYSRYKHLTNCESEECKIRRQILKLELEGKEKELGEYLSEVASKKGVIKQVEFKKDSIRSGHKIKRAEIYSGERLGGSFSFGFHRLNDLSKGFSRTDFFEYGKFNIDSDSNHQLDLINIYHLPEYDSQLRELSWYTEITPYRKFNGVDHNLFRLSYGLGQTYELGKLRLSVLPSINYQKTVLGTHRANLGLKAILRYEYEDYILLGETNYQHDEYIDEEISIEASKTYKQFQIYFRTDIVNEENNVGLRANF